MFQKNHKRLNEQGFASIVIALVLITVLALLTVGFAQLARREQQTALNKQLANQAYYAAESGVNDARTAILNGTLTTSTPKVGGTQCLDLPLPGSGPADISSQNGVSYTCVLANLQPKTLEKDMASDGDWSTYFSTIGGNPSTVVLSWSSLAGQLPCPTATGCPAGVAGFTPSSTWNSRAVMQISITPLTNYSHNGLINNTFTTYGYPTTTPGSVNYSNAMGDQGKITGGGCTVGTSSNPGFCKVTIQIAGTPAAGASLYAMHVHDYYDASQVDFSAYTGSTPLPLGDSQATVDVTGKARDVLKRILVHVPLHASGDLPQTSLEAQNICKRFTTDPVAGSQNAFSSLGYGAGVTGACDVTN